MADCPPNKSPSPVSGFRVGSVRTKTMRIQLGTTGKSQAQGSTGLGQDARSRYQEQLLANVQYSSKYAFNQPTSFNSLADDELVELQRLVAEGPKPNQTPALFEEQALPFAFNSIVEEPQAAVIQTVEETPLFIDATPEEQPASLFRNQDSKKIVQELYNRPAQIGRTQRGTVEFVIQEDGRKLVPEYNRCGILTGIDFGEGTKLTQDAGDGTWCLNSANGRKPLSLKSVAFDKNGSLSIIRATE